MKLAHKRALQKVKGSFFNKLIFFNRRPSFLRSPRPEPSDIVSLTRLTYRLQLLGDVHITDYAQTEFLYFSSSQYESDSVD